MTPPVPTTLLGLKRAWSGLEVPLLGDLEGDHEASFVAPLRTVAPAGLGLVGLPKWFGKRIRAAGHPEAGVNLLRTPSGLVETMPMELRLGPSLADGQTCVVVTYPAKTRKPWPWVRDELRLLHDGRLLGMTYVDLPLLRAAGGTPFILTSVE